MSKQTIPFGALLGSKQMFCSTGQIGSPLFKIDVVLPTTVPVAEVEERRGRSLGRSGVKMVSVHEKGVTGPKLHLPVRGRPKAEDQKCPTATARPAC